MKIKTRLLKLDPPRNMSCIVRKGIVPSHGNMFNQGPFRSATSVPAFFIHIAFGIYKTKIGVSK